VSTLLFNEQIAFNLDPNTYNTENTLAKYTVIVQVDLHCPCRIMLDLQSLYILTILGDELAAISIVIEVTAPALTGALWAPGPDNVSHSIS
jgi:hypothetical protein